MSDPMDDRIKELICGGMQPEIAVMHANEEEELGHRIKTRDELLALYEGLPWDDLVKWLRAGKSWYEHLARHAPDEPAFPKRMAEIDALLARIQEARRG